MRTTNRLFLAATAALTLAFSTSSKAELIFTVTGEMLRTAFGYTVNQPATFVFTLTENTVFGAVNGDYYYWLQFSGFDDPPLYSSVSGTGLVVSSQPSFGSTANGGLNGSGQKYFQLYASFSGVGPDGTTPITSMTITAASSAFDIVTPVTAPAPTAYDYLKSLAGTYNRADMSNFSFTIDGPTASNELRFAPVTLSVVDGSGPGPGPQPVPEPGTWAAAALLAGGAAFMRWRKRREAAKNS